MNINFVFFFSEAIIAEFWGSYLRCFYFVLSKPATKQNRQFLFLDCLDKKVSQKYLLGLLEKNTKQWTFVLDQWHVLEPLGTI